MLSVGYVGSESYHTPLSVNANTAPPQVCQNPQGCDSGGTTLQGAVPRPPYAKVPQGVTYMPPGTRPNPYVGNGVTLSDAGLAPRILRVGLPDRYVTHGAPRLLHEEVGFTGRRIAERIEAAVSEWTGVELR